MPFHMAVLSLFKTFSFDIFSQIQLEHSGENNPFCRYNQSNVHLVLLSQYGCHLLSLYIEEIRVFPIIYCEFFHFAFSS